MKINDGIGRENIKTVLNNRLNKEDGELVTKCNQLKMIAEDGRIRLTDVASAGKLFLQLRYCAD